MSAGRARRRLRPVRVGALGPLSRVAVAVAVLALAAGAVLLVPRGPWAAAVLLAVAAGVGARAARIGIAVDENDVSVTGWTRTWRVPLPEVARLALVPTSRSGLPVADGRRTVVEVETDAGLRLSLRASVTDRATAQRAVSRLAELIAEGRRGAAPPVDLHGSTTRPPRLHSTIGGEVRSAEGWSVRLVGRTTLRYRDAEGVVDVTGDASGTRLGFDADAGRLTALDDARAAIVLPRLRQAATHAGWRLRLDRTGVESTLGTSLELHGLIGVQPLALVLEDGTIDLRDGFSILNVTIDLAAAEIRLLLFGAGTTLTLTLGGVTEIATPPVDPEDPSVFVREAVLLTRPDQFEVGQEKGADPGRGWWCWVATEGGLDFSARLASLTLGPGPTLARRAPSVFHGRAARWRKERSTGRWLLGTAEGLLEPELMRLRTVDLDLINREARLLVDHGSRRLLIGLPMAGLRLGPLDPAWANARVPQDGAGDPLRVLGPSAGPWTLADPWCEIATFGGLRFGILPGAGIVATVHDLPAPEVGRG